MNLYLIEVRFKKPRAGRIGAEAVVHARTERSARVHLSKRFPGCTIVKAIELDSRRSKHFVVADVEA